MLKNTVVSTYCIRISLFCNFTDSIFLVMGHGGKNRPEIHEAHVISFANEDQWIICQSCTFDDLGVTNHSSRLVLFLKIFNFLRRKLHINSSFGSASVGDRDSVDTRSPLTNEVFQFFKTCSSNNWSRHSWRRINGPSARMNVKVTHHPWSRSTPVLLEPWLFLSSWQVPRR